VLRGFFVTGTDTGVGKTMVCAALMHRYRAEAPLRYWKPIQTGIEQDDDTAEVMRLGDCRPGEIFGRGVRLQRPLSPHLAARLSGVTIDLQPLVESVEACDGPAAWIVEGAGGVLVPINASDTMIDFIRLLGLKAIVVARTALGTINHTLLTLEALRGRSLEVAGVVMVGERNAENRTAIEQYGRTTVLGELPRLEPPTAAGLAAWALSGLDAEGRLAAGLR
jgi:dethiobiotin synthetase